MSHADTARNLEFGDDAVLGPPLWNTNAGDDLRRFTIDHHGVRNEYAVLKTPGSNYSAIDPHTGGSPVDQARHLLENRAVRALAELGRPGPVRQDRPSHRGSDVVREAPYPASSRDDPRSVGVAGEDGTVRTVGFVLSDDEPSTFDEASGELRWTVELDDRGWLEHRSVDRDWVLRAYDVASGDLLWQTRHLAQAASPARRSETGVGLLGVSGDRVLVAVGEGSSASPGSVFAFDLSGTMKWSAPIGPLDYQYDRFGLSQTILTDELLLVTGNPTSNGTQALRLVEGTTAWTTATPPASSLDGASRENSRLFLPGRELTVLDLDTGHYQTSHLHCDDLVVADGVLLCRVGDGRGATVAYPLK